jgi:DNA processing protein
MHFNHDPRAVLAAGEDELRRVRGIGPRLAQQIRAVNLEAVERAIPAWQAAGVQILTWHDPAYPARLRALDDAPPTLFVRGRWRARWARCAAVVGTRAPQPESRLRAQNLASALAERGYMIVSGLALGIDTEAHLGALAVPEGFTLAVLGCGVLDVYPSSNRALAQAVMQRGALVSETHPQAAPNAGGAGGAQPHHHRLKRSGDRGRNRGRRRRDARGALCAGAGARRVRGGYTGQRQPGADRSRRGRPPGG